MIKLVVFDLWKTLIYRDVRYSSTARMAEKTGLNIPKDKFVETYEETIRTQKWNSKFEAYKALCEKVGLVATDENINLLINIRDQVEKKTKRFSHTLSMLKELRSQDYKIGLLSNSSIFVMEEIEKANVLKYIDYPVFSYEVGAVKPNPLVFEKMLEISGCKPSEILMIGDNMVDDVIAPKNLGWNSIFFENYEKLKKDLRDYNVVLLT